MKKIILSTFALASLLATPLAQAWQYQDGDAVLIFRESGFNDVEFDLGSINQFLGQSIGQTTTVTNWDLSLVTSTFGDDLTGVDVILAATTSATNTTPVAYLSGVEPIKTAYNVTLSTWHSQLYSIINSIGTRPVIYQAPTAGASSYSLAPNYVAAYDNIVSANGQYTGALPFFGGNSAFKVEATIPGSFELWGISPSSTNPKPADQVFGTFNIDATGALTFVSGPPAATVLGTTSLSGVTSVNFTTTVGGNYQLVFANSLTPAPVTWTAVGGTIPGDGSVHTLSDTNATDAAGFYRVVRTP